MLTYWWIIVFAVMSFVYQHSSLHGETPMHIGDKGKCVVDVLPSADGEGFGRCIVHDPDKPGDFKDFGDTDQPVL